MNAERHNIRFYVKELDCSQEATLLRNAFKKKPGITKVDVHIFQKELHLTYNPTLIDSEKIQQILHATGLESTLLQQESNSCAKYSKSSSLLPHILSLCSLGFLGLGLLFDLPLSFSTFFEFHATPTLSTPPLSLLFYLAAMISGGWFLGKKAIIHLFRFHLDIHVLMLLASIGAAILGRWFEAASVIFLFSLAHLLETFTTEKLRKTITSLMDALPPLSRVIEGGIVVEKNVSEICLDDLILVRPGERIALDGTIVKGHSFINQSAITGESTPVEKQIGDPVFAGTFNEEGSFEFRVTKKTDQTVLAHITKLIQKALGKRSHQERWIDSFAKIYTPVVVLIGACIALLSPLFSSLSFSASLYRGLLLLVISCPCALVIATPVTIIAALASAAKSGLLIKGGLYIEVAAKLKAMAFDKTATLTTGVLSIKNILTLSSYSEKELVSIAAHLESHSNHPIAKALLEKAKLMDLPLKTVAKFQMHVGLGVEGMIGASSFWIGNERLMREKTQQLSSFALSEVRRLEELGYMVLGIGKETEVLGLITLSDQPRPFVKETLSSLRDLGIEEIVMLTGDTKKTAQMMAPLTGVCRFHAELLPQDKISHIEALSQRYGPVAMVGDGINDAPAMAVSSLGIAIGAAATETAFETADIVLLGDDLSHLPALIRHSRHCLRVIKQNALLAIGTKAIFIALAFLGLATLWMAIAADTGVSLIVILSGMRLLKRKF